MAAIDHIRHLHARPQFAMLRLGGEDADLARFHVIENGLRFRAEGPHRVIFQHESVVAAAHQVELRYQRRADLGRFLVRDQRDFLLRFDAQAGADGVVRALNQFRVE